MRGALLFLVCCALSQAQVSVNITGALVQLSWPASAPGYVVERQQMAPTVGSNTPLTPVYAPFLPVPAYTDLAVNRGSAYLYTVMAVPASGPWMKVGTFLVTLPPPGDLTDEIPVFSYPAIWFLKQTPNGGVMCTDNAVLQQVGKDFLIVGNAIFASWASTDAVECLYVPKTGN